MPDHIAIRFSVYPADAATGVRMMAAIVTTARLEPEDVAAQMKQQSESRHSAWHRALNPEPRQWNWLKQADVVDLYRLSFRPENVTLAVGGPIRPGAAKTVWDEATADWQPVRRARRLPPGAEGAPDSAWQGPRIVELRGPHWLLGQEGSTAQLLATIALGGGKGSTAFQGLRIGRGLSYRQEAALWPTRSGVRTRVLVATAADAETIRKAFLEDVGKWDAATLARALGYSRALFGWGADLSPLYLKPASSLGGSLEDRTLWASYWEFKTETPWDPDGWFDEASKVTLDELRAAALTLLRDAEPIVHGG